MEPGAATLADPPETAAPKNAIVLLGTDAAGRGLGRGRSDRSTTMRPPTAVSVSPSTRPLSPRP
jgi:hypothetical protein